MVPLSDANTAAGACSPVLPSSLNTAAKSAAVRAKGGRCIMLDLSLEGADVCVVMVVLRGAGSSCANIEIVQCCDVLRVARWR